MRVSVLHCSLKLSEQASRDKMKKGRRNDKGKKLAGKAAARALVWLLLPLLVFVVLNSDHMPQLPLQATTLCKSPRFTSNNSLQVPLITLEATSLDFECSSDLYVRALIFDSSSQRLITQTLDP